MLRLHVCRRGKRSKSEICSRIMLANFRMCGRSKLSSMFHKLDGVLPNTSWKQYSKFLVIENGFIQIFWEANVITTILALKYLTLAAVWVAFKAYLVHFWAYFLCYQFIKLCLQSKMSSKQSSVHFLDLIHRCHAYKTYY